MKKVDVVAYDPLWPERFEEEKEKFCKLIDRNALRLFHVGSTSVPQLSASPMIDMLLVVESFDVLDTYEAILKEAGYLIDRTEGKRPELLKEGRYVKYHIAVYRSDEVYAIISHLAFRDYLRASRDVTTMYGQLKLDLAKMYPDNRAKYDEGKALFVEKIEQDALRWYWMQYYND